MKLSQPWVLFEIRKSSARVLPVGHVHFNLLDGDIAIGVGLRLGETSTDQIAPDGKQLGAGYELGPQFIDARRGEEAPR